MYDLPVFEEKQQFRQLWLWIVVAGADFLILLKAYQYFMNHTMTPDKPLDGLGIIISIVALIGVTVLFYLSKLETKIYEQGISVRFYPFHLKFKRFKWSDLEKSFVRQYRPIGEFGGWGLRIGSGNNAYNVSGNKGLQLSFHSGYKLLIGTQNPEELDRTLKALGRDIS